MVLLLVPALALAQNAPPVADAGEDQDVLVGDLVFLNGTATDADGDPIESWLWTIEFQPAGSGAFLSNPFRPDPWFIADVAGDYVLSLVANDGTDDSAPDFVTITAADNLPPVAVATADVTEGPAPLTVQFDGSQSSDPEGFPLFYRWNFNDGPLPAEEMSPTHVFILPGTYLVELWVLDHLNLRDIDVIRITVTEGPPIVEVDIDIKPGSDTNSINISSAGVIPVAILSSTEFDATTVAPESVSLTGARVKMVGKAGKYLCHVEDVNSDTLDDLLCQVYTEHFMMEIGQTIAVLEAETFDGVSIRGQDVVRIVPDN
ncbi:MAG: PKD domain-containing protein [Pseudomonadota bacterium]